jgi:hypothetical protein
LLYPNNRITYKIWEGFDNRFLLPESCFHARQPKAHPWNPKRRCLWLLRKKPKRKPKRKRSKLGVVEDVVVVM